MIESVYGGQAISGIIVQAQEKPKAIEIEPVTAKKKTKDQTPKPSAKSKTKPTEPAKTDVYEIKTSSKPNESEKIEA
jgi:electron transfer flavoprotein alpha subunit